ncbi:hypothetical protein Q9189_001891 [Teloschistes chrysophthalmus]
MEYESLTSPPQDPILHLAKGQSPSTSISGDRPKLFKIVPGAIDELRKRFGLQKPVFVLDSPATIKHHRVVKAQGPGTAHVPDPRGRLRFYTLIAQPWDDKHYYWSVREFYREYIVAEQPSVGGRVVYRRLLASARMDQFEPNIYAYATNGVDSVPGKVDLTSQPKNGASSSQETRPELPCSSKSTTALLPGEQNSIFIPDPSASVQNSSVLSRGRESVQKPALSSNPGLTPSVYELDDEDMPLSWSRSRATGNLQTSNHQAQETPFIITPEAIAELRRQLGNQTPPFVTELFNGRKEGLAVLASPTGRHPRDAKIKPTSCHLTAQQWDDNEKHYYWTVQHKGCQYIVVRQQIKAGRVAYKRWLGLGNTIQLESRAFAYEREQPIPVSHGPKSKSRVTNAGSEYSDEPPMMRSRSSATGVSSHRTSRTPLPESIRLPDRVASSAINLSNDISSTRRSLSANPAQASQASQALLRRREERRLEKRQIRQQQMVLLKDQKERQQAEERLYADRLRELEQEEREDFMMDMS